MTLLALCAILASPLWTNNVELDAVSPIDEQSRQISEVRSRFDELVAGAKTLDVESYLRFFDAERFTGLSHDGTVWHELEEFARDYSLQVEAVDEFLSLEFSRVKISPVGEQTVVLVNEYEATLRLKSGSVVSASGAGTQVWSKASGEWLLVSVSSSVGPE